ncbi:MAG TPA: methyltransferase domain-containing protein [Usitatibacter sp.]|nr:methyltransferase domain-containing protein [Usitatibacter sp.]
MDARRLEGEWLDELPADDPRAQRSRADLRRINAIMGNAGIVASALKPIFPEPPLSMVELGAGDGEFALRLTRLLGARGLQVTLVDRQQIVSAATLRAFGDAGASVNVAQADVFEWLAGATRVDLIVANLFLHHFEDEPLARMLSLIAARSRAFVACETRRSAFAMAGARMLRVIGCNDVTMHDAAVSIRAGFRDGDLAKLWPSPGGWSLREESRGLFSHLFAAHRTSS